ncbi:Hypothetical protein PHPALM_10306 [Phytophthora palmivora]|uniref:Uncharacterized protein n=1 Tax=Phytophthora palmivora TaxID=4796 RepID=A0A2P4Y5C7_9STRA|nr:Hypothetical protein PHPALM_10306 [Phytophthora palmivora]
MSTLTSAQLHVKRSSTRLHAPPGGCGGLGTVEPAVEDPSKDEHAYSRPKSSSRYSPLTTSFYYNNNASSGYPSYSTPQPEAIPYNNYPPSQQSNQYQAPCNSMRQNSYNCSSNNVSNQPYASNNGFQGGRPPSSTPSSRASNRSSSSSRSWGSQPPLTSSKRDQNWEKKRRLWLARKNSNSHGDCPSTSSSTWSSDPAGGLDDSINPPSPLSKLMNQHAQQQQQPPPTPGGDYQRLGSASNNSYVHQPYTQQSYPASTQTPGAGYPVGGGSFSRVGLSTASSTTSSTASSRRQPPGGPCQWSLG